MSNPHATERAGRRTATISIILNREERDALRSELARTILPGDGLDWVIANGREEFVGAVDSGRFVVDVFDQIGWSEHADADEFEVRVAADRARRWMGRMGDALIAQLDEGVKDDGARRATHRALGVCERVLERVADHPTADAGQSGADGDTVTVSVDPLVASRLRLQASYSLAQAGEALYHAADPSGRNPDSDEVLAALADVEAWRDVVEQLGHHASPAPREVVVDAWRLRDMAEAAFVIAKDRLSADGGGREQLALLAALDSIIDRTNGDRETVPA